ncbi:MAG: hypothetical protein KJ950_07785 [Proteobacteria bacterium]|nr:hypothetical protein [Pseudomonadota bacterium]MBU1687258.1 hypothetical protein [Pseudomonadota bacterium]
MKISGFTFLRNGSKLYYPITESIRSALPLVDEFVVALGQGDPDDQSREMIESIDSDKIRIIDTTWDLERYPRGMEHAHQTDIAKQACTGDWLIYLQGDEVLHEEDLPVLRERCQKYLNRPEVEGMVLDYLHFWGNYNHHHLSHGWYKREIRLVRNLPEIHSFASAQSFRKIINFDGVSYRNKKGAEKLHCVPARARIFHYGWVRPPEKMQMKSRYIDTNHHGKRFVSEKYKSAPPEFDYGPLSAVARYHGTHPQVMREKIATLSWGDKLYEHEPAHSKRPRHKHERLKYRLLTWLEQNLLGGRSLGDSHNFTLIKD